MNNLYHLFFFFFNCIFSYLEIISQPIRSFFFFGREWLPLFLKKKPSNFFLCYCFKSVTLAWRVMNFLVVQSLLIMQQIMHFPSICEILTWCRLQSLPVYIFILLVIAIGLVKVLIKIVINIKLFCRIVFVNKTSLLWPDHSLKTNP